MKFDTIDFKGLDDIDNFYPILDKNQIKTHIRVPGKIGLYPPSYLTIDPSELESLENNNISITPSDVVDDIAYQASEKINLPKIAQDRISKLQEYASSIDISKVKIDKDGISILLPSGELRLGFQPDESSQALDKNRHAPTEQQLKDLLKLFGERVGPYIDILGLNNTHNYGGYNYSYNRYWGKATDDSKFGVYSLHLNKTHVEVSLAPAHHFYGSFSMQN